MRFRFGKNWKNFAEIITEDKILESEKNLKKFLELENLKGKTFLDVGCGSGLSSLAAKRMGATVTSYDYDLESVECSKNLKNKFFRNDNSWKIIQGDILDSTFCKSLGFFDIIYAWGVLHHTGDQWKAMKNIKYNTRDESLIYLALYNDQGSTSKIWRIIKQMYSKVPFFLKPLYVLLMSSYTELKRFLYLSIKFQLFEYFRTFKNYKNNRGMSYWYDMVDWIGGYPFEVSKPHEVFNFFKDEYNLENFHSEGKGKGNNLYLFKKKII